MFRALFDTLPHPPPKTNKQTNKAFQWESGEQFLVQHCH